MESNRYAEKRGEGWYVAGTRISLDSVIYAFLEGLSPEATARECFPDLSLEQVYGAIAFYLAHRKELDAYLTGAGDEFERQRNEQQAQYPGLTAKLAQARRELAVGAKPRSHSSRQMKISTGESWPVC